MKTVLLVFIAAFLLVSATGCGTRMKGYEMTYYFSDNPTLDYWKPYDKESEDYLEQTAADNIKHIYPISYNVVLKRLEDGRIYLRLERRQKGLLLRRLLGTRMVAEIFLIQDVPIGKTFRVATYLDSFTCEYDDFVIGKFQYKQLDGRITFKNQSDCMEVILCITFSNKHHGPGKMPYPNAEKIFGSFNIKKGLIAENGAK